MVTSHRQAFRELQKLVGPKPAAEVTSEDIVNFADHLRDRPTPRGGTLSRAAIVKLLQHIKAFFGWAHARRIIREDPSSGVQSRRMTATERNNDDETGKRAFTYPELRTIFDSPLFAGCLSASRRTDPGTLVLRDARFCFLLTAFLTGARVSELPEATIVADEGVLWLDMTETATKNKRSRRRVPILTPLRRAGFVTWARERERLGLKPF